MMYYAVQQKLHFCPKIIEVERCSPHYVGRKLFVWKTVGVVVTEE
jgi:hypothetical protein